MNEVAEACGVSKPSLYHYFRDKQHLLLEIAAAHVARLEALVEEVGAETHEPEAPGPPPDHGASSRSTPARRPSTAS